MVEMRGVVYIETSVIDAYFDEHRDVESMAQRHWSRKWWDEVRPEYHVVVSEAVVDELSHPDHPKNDECVRLINSVPRLRIDEGIREVVRYYIAHGVMPRDPVGDALHLALASYHKCDYLLTWNCRHIANPNKFRSIRLANGALGLFVPALVTPNQLLGGENE